MTRVMTITEAVVSTIGLMEISIAMWRSDVTSIRKLITSSPIVDASLVRNFDKSEIGLGMDVVGLTTSDYLYWEVVSREHVRDSVIYRKDRVVVNGVTPTDGFVCNHYDSVNLIHEFGQFSEVYGFMAEIEGVMDEGLLVGRDFTLVEGVAAAEMREREPVLMISEAAKGAWWIYKIRLSVSALIALLDSNTIGYQLGFFVILKDGGHVRLIREIGFDMQSMDLVLTDLNLTDEIMDKAVSVF